MYLWVAWDATRDLGANMVWSQYRYGPFTLHANAEQNYVFTLDSPPVGKQFRSVLIFWADNFPKQEFDEKNGWLIRNSDGSVQPAPAGYNGPSFILPASGQSTQQPTPQQTIQSTENTVDYKMQECVDKYGKGFYYDASQDKCFPPSGSWNEFRQHIMDLQCQNQFGSGFYFEGSQNSCLPPGGSWSTTNTSYMNQQCENQFWPSFYYDTSNNACLPPGGSWQDFIPPQASVTDQQGTVNFNVAGQNIPITLVDKKTGLPLAGLTVSFALDPETRSYGALLIIDPNDNYPPQFALLQVTSSSGTAPTSWNSGLVFPAFAQEVVTSTRTVTVSKDPPEIPNYKIELPIPEEPEETKKTEESGGLVMNALFMVLKAADASGLPVGKFASQLKFVDKGSTPINDAGKELLDDLTQKKPYEYVGEIVKSGGEASPVVVANEFIDLNSAAMDIHTIAKCEEAGNDKVSWVKFGGSTLYYCDSVDTGKTDGKLMVNPFPQDPNAKAYLVNKNVLGEEIVCSPNELNDGCPIPSGNYRMQFDTKNQDPQNKDDIRISPGQTTTVDLNAPPSEGENNNQQNNNNNQGALTPIPSNNYAVNPPQIQVLGGTCTVNQYCDILIATATDGLAPYYFKSDTFANGAPPFGMTIGIYGHLTGTPTQAGQYNVPVCVVDTAGKSSCGTATLNVNPQNNPLQITGDLSGTWQGNFVADYSRTDDFGIHSCKMQGTFTFDVTKNDDGSFYGTETATVPDNGIIQGDCGAWGSAPNNIGMTITINADGIFSGSTDFWQSTIYDGHFTDTNSIQFNWKYTDPDGKGTWIGTFTGSK